MQPTPTWQDVRTRLAEELAGLDPDEFVVLSEPDGQPDPEQQPGLLGRLLGRRPESAPVRWVQYRNDDGSWIYGECVGSTLFDGDWEIDQVTHDRLRQLGWLAPGDPDPTGTRPDYPAYWQCRGSEHAADLAAMGVEALRLLGTDPTTLTWRHGSAP